MEPGDLPEVLPWDGCAQTDMWKKWLNKKLYAKDIGQFQKKTEIQQRIYGPFQAFGLSWENTIFLCSMRSVSAGVRVATVLAACVAIIALEWDTAKLSSCTAPDWRGTPVCSGWHPAQMQVNTSRDSVAAAGPPFKNASVPPSTIPGPALPSVPPHHDQTAPFQTKCFPLSSP